MRSQYSIKVEWKVCLVAIKPTFLYGTECWSTKIHRTQNMIIMEISSNTKRDKVRNENILSKIDIVPI